MVTIFHLGGQALADLIVDFRHELRVLREELLRVLPSLAELLALVGVPGTGLLHDAELDRDVKDRTLSGDPRPVHDVELGGAEGRGALVLRDLYPCAVARHLRAVLDLLDTSDVEADGRVELERPASGSDLRAAVYHTDLFSQLVDEDRDRLGLVDRAGQLAQRLGHETGL